MFQSSGFGVLYCGKQRVSCNKLDYWWYGAITRRKRFGEQEYSMQWQCLLDVQSVQDIKIKRSVINEVE
jgi:hypothetical protein